MPSQTMSPPLTVTVLAALWVSLGRCGGSGSPGPGCDSGKLSLDKDLRADAVYWDCAVSTWPESTQRLPSVDTVYDPEPARPTCMDQPISFNHTLPSSGAYRPVRAESGEYLYCPPQRWLNNLHHGATVLLYHPCSPLPQRHLLSGLARSCLPDYILTPHPQLNEHMPIALVSWGRTLELSTVSSSDICDWLENTTPTGSKTEGVTQTRKYNLLLTRPAGLRRQEQAEKMKESVRQCCEQTISSLLSGATEAELEPSVKREHFQQIKDGGKSRPIRATIRKQQENNKERDNTTTNVSAKSQTNTTIPRRTGDVQNYSSMLAPSAASLSGKRTLSDPSVSGEAPQSEIQKKPQGLTPGHASPAGSETRLKTESVGVGAPQFQKGGLMLQTAALQPGLKQTDLRHPDTSAGRDVGVNRKHNRTAGPEAPALRSKDEGPDSIKHRDKESDSHSMKAKGSKETADGKMKDNEVVEVKEREVERKQIHSATHSHHKSENTGLDSVPKSKSESQPQHPPASNSQDCDSCTAGEHCDCTEESGAQGRADVVNGGLPRTPRTDEAVWAAAALGFLLVLLTLSVLHTRLYRHWRTTSSLYWHDPRQDYDSVADVIRRRLRIAKRRRKRSRRQECVLLPSSSSSDEHP
ncbi:uncharacterized protein tp53i13 [Embiotoca jacksoni]|uniref:uncharacterized protein tp53i13 n=1 Tax=Embiotoca jacksoni TaxID=100190 RepID=UPI00370448EC